MPEPQEGETRSEFMERCIPFVLNEGTAENQDQAVAICSGIWREAKGEPEPEPKSILFSPPLAEYEIKSDGDWEVSGYVSVFGNVDLGGDIVLPGAFKKTLASKRRVSFLYNHDPGRVLGAVKSLKEDRKGLFGTFKISKTPLGQEVHQLLIDGAITGFSFGYEAMDFSLKSDGVRELKEVNLYEASLVSMPMNDAALVTAYKQFAQEQTPLAERMSAINAALAIVAQDLRGLIEKIDRPLSEAKRRELTELQRLCLGIGSRAATFEQFLAISPKTARVVEARLIKHQMDNLRKKLKEGEN